MSRPRWLLRDAALGYASRGGVERRKALVFHSRVCATPTAFATATRFGDGVLFGEGRHAFRRSTATFMRCRAALCAAPPYNGGTCQPAPGRRP